MSDKPLAQRLQVKGDRRLAVVGPPAALKSVIGAADRRTGVADANVVLLFIPDRGALETRLPAVTREAATDAILWLAYPKLTSPLAGDLHRDVIRALAPGFGLEVVSQIAVDADWSALRVKRVG